MDHAPRIASPRCAKLVTGENIMPPAVRSGIPLTAVLVSLALTGALGRPPAISTWVYPGPDGKLVYKTTPAGDRIMDFSSAGYEGGGVALPTVPVKITVRPSGGQD